jgi:hypothetical protein
MGTVTLHGSWHLRVVVKHSDWPQRVVVNGAATGTIPGHLGASTVLSGDHWYLDIEHEFPGHGWRRSPYVEATPVNRQDGRIVQIVSKDYYWPGDARPNDLVLELESVGPTAEVRALPWPVDDNLTSLGTEFGGSARFLAVGIRNVGCDDFGYDATLDVSDAGRQALAGHGILVAESWSDEALRQTGQEAHGRAVVLPPVEVGRTVTAYFPIDGSAARPGVTDVEFKLHSSGRDGRRKGESLLARASVGGDSGAARGSVEDGRSDLAHLCEPATFQAARLREAVPLRAAGTTAAAVQPSSVSSATGSH